MSETLISLLLAFAAGLFASTQGAINASIAQSTGQSLMIVLVSLAQALAGGLFLWKTGGTLPPATIPWIMLAGLLGIGIMYGISASMGSVGALTVFLLLIFGQIAASALIDHFGLFGVPRHPLSLPKIGSIAIILIGIFCLIKSS